jgi:type II secretory pathway pseudopilin PulG
MQQNFFHHGRQLSSGFTLLEVLLVLGMGVLFVSLTLPVGVRFYQFQVADETTLEVLSALRVAAFEARLGKHDRAFGIKFFSDRYVIFEGGSYASRTQSEDHVIPFPLGASVASTTSEFVFTKWSGGASATGTVTMTLYDVSHTLSISERGIVTQLN